MDSEGNIITREILQQRLNERSLLPSDFNSTAWNCRLLTNVITVASGAFTSLFYWRFTASAQPRSLRYLGLIGTWGFSTFGPLVAGTYYCMERWKEDVLSKRLILSNREKAIEELRTTKGYSPLAPSSYPQSFPSSPSPYQPQSFPQSQSPPYQPQPFPPSQSPPYQPQPFSPSQSPPYQPQPFPPSQLSYPTQFPSSQPPSYSQPLPPSQLPSYPPQPFSPGMPPPNYQPHYNPPTPYQQSPSPNPWPYLPPINNVPVSRERTLPIPPFALQQQSASGVSGVPHPTYPSPYYHPPPQFQQAPPPSQSFQPQQPIQTQPDQLPSTAPVALQPQPVQAPLQSTEPPKHTTNQPTPPIPSSPENIVERSAQETKND